MRQHLWFRLHSRLTNTVSFDSVTRSEHCVACNLTVAHGYAKPHKLPDAYSNAPKYGIYKTCKLQCVPEGEHHRVV